MQPHKLHQQFSSPDMLTNVQVHTGGQSMRTAKAANPETFESQAKNEQFIQSVHIAVTMQINTFAHERMKSCTHCHSCTEGWLSLGGEQDQCGSG